MVKENKVNPLIDGDDIISYILLDQSITGSLNISPLSERLDSFFKYRIEINKVKPYRAYWVIMNAKLHLYYVDGIKDNKLYQTDDLVMEYPENNDLYFYDRYSGELDMFITDEYIPEIFQNLIGNHRNIVLTIENGILLRARPYITRYPEMRIP